MAPTFAQIGLLSLGLAFYLLAAILAFLRARNGQNNLSRLVRPLLLAAVVLNASMLVLRSHDGGWSAPRTSLDSLVLFTGLAACVVLLLGISHRLRSLELYFLPLIAVFHASAFLVMNQTSEIVITTKSWFNLHQLTMVSGAVCLAGGGVGAMMYLVAAGRLRRKETERVIGQAPPLETLEKICWYGVSIGFALLTFGILAGICEIYRDVDPLSWLGDPKILSTFVAWLFYLAVLLVRWVPRYRGRPAALLNVASFLVLAVVLIVTEFLTQKHP